ncbi:MAG TPA: response regulator [Candidatus Wallbacteria bacterium]|nr:response regulator [Candidatus Wallbacteria bacterium]
MDISPTANKATILAVDDTPDNLSLISGILRNEYKVKIAANGKKALDIAAAAPPDLILLDITMPDMDGYEVCRRLKQNPATQKIPVIFISAKNEEIDELVGLEMGTVDYITKPFCPSIVLARIKTHLALTAAIKELEKQNAVLSENVRLRENVEKMTRHDLKAPLTAFINIPEMLLRETGISSDHKEMLGVLKQSAIRMLEMINRSLDMCKIEQGTYNLVCVPVNIVKVVYQVFQQFDRQAKLKNISYSIFFNGKHASPEDVIEFSGEEFLFYSLLSNLVKNAVEASPVNGDILVMLEDTPSPSISIKNQGAVPPEIRDRIFQRYTTSGKEKGTGLGVYSARLMARTLGGDLNFTTSASDGTTFTVVLGSAASPAGYLAQDQTIISGAGQKHAMTKSRQEIKILIVDDFFYMRLIIKDVLKKEGYIHFFEAEDGEKAIAFLKHNQTDLVLCDWNIPGISGLQVAEFMQNNEMLKSVPFIMITANTALSQVEEAAEKGVRNYLAKPFSPDLLCRKVEAVLSQ